MIKPNEILSRILVGCVDRPLRVVSAWAGVLLVFGIGIVQLRVDTTISSFLDRTDESWKTYEQSLRTFGGDEFVVVGFHSLPPFSKVVLRAVAEFSAKAQGLPGVRRVDSVATVPLIRADRRGQLSLTPLPEGTLNSGEILPADSQHLLLADRLAPGALVSEAGDLFAVNIILGDDIDGDREATVRQIRKLVEADNVLITGVPVFRSGVSERTREEVVRFVPIAMVVIASIIFLIFGSAVPVLVCLSVGGTGVVVCLGGMGFASIPLSVSTMVLPPVLLALGAAYAMHLLSRAANVASRAEVCAFAEQVAPGVLFSGLTTAIGFGAMATVDIGVISDLAISGAVGVLGTTAAALTLAPAFKSFMHSWSQWVGPSRWIAVRLSGALVRISVRHTNAVIGCWALAALVALAGAMQLEVSSNIIPWFPKGSDIRDSYEEIRTELSGITPLNVVIDAGEAGAAAKPDLLARVDLLVSELRNVSSVGKVLSIGDPLEQLNEVVTGAEGVGLPRDAETIEQYLLLLDGMPQVDDLLSRDWKKLNVQIRANSNESDQIIGIGEWIRQWWANHGMPGVRVDATGIMYEFAEAQDEIALGQMKGLGIAIAAISGVLVGILRRGDLAILAAIPNAVPIWMAFGLMGALGVRLDAATVCIGSLALGIGVDDTVHIMLAWRRSKKLLLQQRLLETFADVLPAVISTSVVIAGGFLCLVVSDFSLIRSLGWVTASVVGLCLAADLTLLPALLVRFLRSEKYDQA